MSYLAQSTGQNAEIVTLQDVPPAQEDFTYCLQFKQLGVVTQNNSQTPQRGGSRSVFLTGLRAELLPAWSQCEGVRRQRKGIWRLT